MNYLRELYYAFEIKPYAESIPRSLRKEGKLYLWDFGAGLLAVVLVLLLAGAGRLVRAKT